MKERRIDQALNVLGQPLQPCGLDPLTGFYRDGCCNTGYDDPGIHVVCVRVTRKFLEFSRKHGNDLTTPVPAAGFPGLRPGNQWCLCAGRWKQALDAGVAPPVVLAATHEEALAVVPLAELKRHALDLS
jgi:uncharacterized protein (DUF2237 family)